MTQLPTNVRWKTLFLMSLAGFMLYFTRNNISIAGKYIQDDFSLSTQELGWIFTAFTIGYAIFQIPTGILAQRLGARKMVFGMLTSWCILTVLTGFLPGVLFSGTTAILAVLIIIRILMGVGQASFFSVASGVLQNWFPSSKFGIATGVESFILYFGGAMVSPITVFLIKEFGWRASFYITSPILFVLAVVWWWYTRDRPEEHKGTNEPEVELINVKDTVEVTNTIEMNWYSVLKQKPILFLAMSYFCQAYVVFFFYNWLFIYLIEDRGFGDLEGGFASAVPWLTGAAAAIAGGFFTDAMAKKYSPGKALKYICVGSLILVAAFMYSGAIIENKYAALFLLSVCYAFVQVTEIVYWQATMLIAGDQTVVACSILNTAGNVTGFFAIPLLAFFLDSYGSLVALASCSVFAILASFLFLFVDANKQIEETTGDLVKE